MGRAALALWTVVAAAAVWPSGAAAGGPAGERGRRVRGLVRPGWECSRRCIRVVGSSTRPEGREGAGSPRLPFIGRGCQSQRPLNPYLVARRWAPLGPRPSLPFPLLAVGSVLR